MVGDVNSQWHTLVRAIKVSDRFEVGTHTFFMIWPHWLIDIWWVSWLFTFYMKRIFSQRKITEIDFLLDSDIYLTKLLFTLTLMLGYLEKRKVSTRTKNANQTAVNLFLSSIHDWICFSFALHTSDQNVLKWRFLPVALYYSSLPLKENCWNHVFH